MNSFLLITVLIVLAGTLVGFQIPLNSLLSSRVGLLEGALVVHLVGAIFAGVALLIFWTGGLAAWRTVPWYGYLGGVFGVMLITVLSFATPKIGVTATLVIFLVSQLIVGAIIGHFGWLETPIKPINLAKLGGFGLLIAGAWLVVKP
jgi:bacterial/archaeal transporter family-2 protein